MDTLRSRAQGPDGSLQVAALVFDQLTPLDIVGPIEVLARVPGIEIVIVGLDGRPVRDSRTHWQITPEADLDEVTQPAILLIPGGAGVDRLRADERVIRWIRDRHESAIWTASVCTGALLLAEAGLLAGRYAATHRGSREELARLGVNVVDERVVRDGKLLTSAGVSAGIELGLVLASALRGADSARDIQRRIEYEPGPAFRLEIPDHAGDLPAP